MPQRPSGDTLTGVAGDRGRDWASTDSPVQRSPDNGDGGDGERRGATDSVHPVAAPSDAMRAELDGRDGPGPPDTPTEASRALPSESLAPSPEMQARLDQLRNGIDPPSAADEPEAVDEPDVVGLPEDENLNLHYESVQGRDVLPDHPTVDSARQRNVGDCYLVAAVDSVSRAEPERWSEIVHDEGDTVTVDFTKNGQVTPVTVAKTALVDGNGELYGAVSDDGTTMVPLVEKAYAKEFANNSYVELDEGGWPHESLEAITGRPGRESSPEQLGPDGLRELVDGGHPVCAGSRADGDLSPADLQDRLDNEDSMPPSDPHAYVVTGVDQSGQVHLHNPWGENHVTLPWNKFERQYFYVGWS